MSRAVLSAAGICLILCCILSVKNAQSRSIGFAKQLEGDDFKIAEEKLVISLRKLAANKGPNFKISKVKSVSYQLVAGALYKYEVDLVDDDDQIMECNVKLRSRPWVPNGTKVTINCPSKEEIVVNQS